MNAAFYCLSFGGENREKMQTKFSNLGLHVTVNPGVPPTDGRIVGRGFSPGQARVWSIMYGHLDMIRWFYYTSTADVGFFCEDDILIRTDFAERIPDILARFYTLDLDIMSIGYLCENPIDTYTNFPTLLPATEEFPYKILGYPDANSVWGTQMYALSRKKAGEILKKYETGYAEGTVTDPQKLPYFAADWILTKDGKRALIYPLLVIEGSKGIDHEAHDRSHRACHSFMYKEGEFI
jgi:hypothetical protein